MSQQKKGLNDLLGNLVDKDGFKTDITLGFDNLSLVKLGVCLVATTALCSVAHFTIRHFANRLAT